MFDDDEEYNTNGRITYYIVVLRGDIVEHSHENIQVGVWSWIIKNKIKSL